MPQIPYSPVAEVKQAGAPGAFLTPNGDTGAGLVGAAVSNMGKTLGQAADRQEEIDIKLAGINNDTEANQAEVGLAKKMSDIRSEYQALPGDQAVARKDEFDKRMNDALDETLAGINNPAVKRQVGNIGRQRYIRENDNIATHFATESRRANIASKAAVSETSARDAINADDDGKFEESYADSLHMAEEASKAAGQGSDEEVRNAKQKASDDIMKQRLSGISASDPIRAKNLFDQYKDRMSPAVQQGLTKVIQNDTTRMETKRVGDDIVNGATGYDDYERRTTKQESGDSPGIKNPNSSATGLGQFTKDTWADMDKAHPELGLGSFSNAKDPEKAKAALKAFTLDNAKILTDAGLDPTQKNLYMTHFLGQAGGPAFLSAMQSDPTQNAAKMFPDAAKSNQSVFYKPDGTARTLQEVYNRQTQTFSNAKLGGLDNTGLKPLTPSSTQADIDRMAAEARSRFDGNVEAQDKAEAYVRQRGANVIAQAKDIQKQNFNLINRSASDGENEGKAPTSLDELFQKQPQARQAYYAMDVDQQNRIDKTLERNADRNAKVQVPMTQERIARVRELNGLFYSDRDAFNKLVIGNEDLPKKERDALQNKQMSVSKPSEDSEWELTQVLGKLNALGVQGAAKLSRTKDKKSYDQFIGAVQERLETAKAKGETWDDNSIRQLGKDLLRETVISPGRFWDTKGPAFKAGTPVPDTNRDQTMPKPEIVDLITKQWASANGGRAPTKDQLMKVYTNNKDALDKRYGK